MRSVMRRGVGFSVLALLIVMAFLCQTARATFSEVPAGFTNAYYGVVRWVDYDNDGQLDLFLSGQDSSLVARTLLYHNDGSGQFTVVSTPFPNLCYPSADWGDFDNDGDLDLVYKGTYGQNGSSHGCQVFRNDGYGQFVAVAGVPNGHENGSVTWADFDNDGRLDILFCQPIYTLVLRNLGGNAFTNLGLVLVGAGYAGSPGAADYNGDNLLDVFLPNGSSTRLYRNLGTNAFQDSGTSFPTLNEYSASAWGDYDDDGRPDLVMSGYMNGVSAGETRIYRNNGTTLTNINAGLPSARNSSVAWGDCNNNGRLDLFLSGNYSTRVLLNLGTNGFVDSGDALTGVSKGFAAFGDYDNDGALDIVVMGLVGVNTPSTKLYHNQNVPTNTAPTSPSNFTNQLGPNSALLTWGTANDAEQIGGLNYNVRIGTTPGGIDVLSPMADVATGRRLVPRLGNAGYRRSLIITNIAAGTYYWSVQAIDHGFASSTFASEQSFILAAPVITNQISNQTVLAGAPAYFEIGVTGINPICYQWKFNGTNFLGATNASLTISNAQYGNQGTYAVVASNPHGTITSSNAFLTVLSPPSIGLQPQSRTNVVGNWVSFSATASGTLPLYYQWFKAGSPLVDNGRLWGATSNSLTFASALADDAGPYRLVVTNDYGSVTSAPANLTVQVPTAVLSLDFGVETQSLKSGPAAIGQGSNDFWNYYTASATNLVNPSLADGQITSTKFTLIGPRAGWTNANPDPMFRFYLYQYEQPGFLAVETTNLPGGTYDLYYYGLCGDIGFNLFINGVSQGLRTTGYLLGVPSGDSTNWTEGVHYVVFRNVTITANQLVRVEIRTIGGPCTAVVSGLQFVRSLSEPPKPVFWTHPQHKVVPPGSNFMYLESVTGQSPIQYQWFRNGLPLVDDAQVIGSTSNVLAVSNSQTNHTGLYWMVASNIVGVSTTAMAYVFVGVPPTVLQPPLSRTNILGTSATFTAIPDGTPPLTHRWLFNSTFLTNNSHIAGATNATLSISNVLTSDAGTYRLVITNGAGAVTSAPASLTVWVPPTFTAQPANRTVLGGSNVTFQTLASGTAPLAYQWQLNDLAISNATGSSLTLTNLKRAHSGNYSVLVTNVAGSILSSNAVLNVHVPQRLGTPQILPDGTMRFSARDADGALLPPSVLTNFGVRSSTNLQQWILIPNGLTFTNGELQLVQPIATNVPIQFYQLFELW